MKQPFLQLLRNRWFAAFIHACLWILVFLAAFGVTGKMPDVREEEAFSVPPQDPVPVAKLGQLFGGEFSPRKPAATTNEDAFYTRYFVPPPTPTPPVPTTRKFELIYEGYYGTSDGPKQTLVKLGDTFIVAPVGGRVISNLFVSDVSFQALSLTNTTGQTNVLLLNVKKEVEVPIK
jgi:hypothetical protein